MATVDVDPDFLADLYEAALHRDGLARICTLVRSCYGVDTAGLWIVEDGRFTAMELSEHLLASQAPYMEHFAEFDPWHEGTLRRPNEVVVACETLPEHDLVNTEFY